MVATMTKHARVDRQARLNFILDTVGVGNIVAGMINTNNGHPNFECLTDTGVLLVFSPDRKILITAYIPNTEKAVAVYLKSTQRKSLPDGLYNKIKANQKIAKKQPH